MSCPCGTERPIAECCGRYLAGEPAPTAEALMRSRYTAYVEHDIDYIVETHDPERRRDLEPEEASRWSRESKWLGLTIVDSQLGGVEDEEGEVEFIAEWSRDGDEFAHHERSRFRRIAGRWHFVDGREPKRTPAVREARPKPNVPCPCGSGLKFKRCHGR